MRCSSASRMRMFFTRSGTSTPSSFSTDMQNAMLLDCALR